MNKRIRKKKEKQAWERMQYLIGGPVPVWKQEYAEHFQLKDSIDLPIISLPDWFDRQYAESFNLNYGVAQQEVQGSSYEILKQFREKYPNTPCKGPSPITSDPCQLLYSFVSFQTYEL